jgi:hypothetical protein
MWAPDGPGTAMAKEQKLPDPLASIMCTTPDTGEVLYMFSAAGTVYIWNVVADTVYKIVNPAAQDDIIASIQKSNGDTKQLQVEEVLPAVDPDA